MPDPMLAREFQDGDLEQLRLIYLQSRRAAFRWLDTSKYRLPDFDRDTRGELILVAESAGVVRGFSSSWIPDRFIHHLYVSPAHLREGVGEFILQATLQAIGVPARLKCLSLNHRALSFYSSKGWRITGRGCAEDGEYYEMEL
jgi:GNAT superfamily N-acetyltransferase